jgi:hypothetical protein
MCSALSPSPPFRGERAGPSAERWEGIALETPHLTPALSTPKGGDGEELSERRGHAIHIQVYTAPSSCSALMSASP